MHNQEHEHASDASQLLVRTARGYVPTPRGLGVLSEIEIMLPRLEQLLGDTTFVASQATTVFRVAATDYSSNVVCPVLVRRILPAACGSVAQFEASVWSSSARYARRRLSR